MYGGDISDDLALLKKMENKEEIDKRIKLLDYQQPHAEKLIKILEQNGYALDASDPGIGKTYIASYVCKILNVKPVVLCPKNVVSKWRSVLEEFGVEYLLVSNYELVARGKYIYKNAKLVCPYIKITKDKKPSYEWKVPKDAMFIFDEVHRCKFIDTFNARMLMSAKETGNKILMLSATIVEKPYEFAIFGYILGIGSSIRILADWIRKLTTPAKTIYSVLYDEKNPLAARLTIAELGDKFPETQITAETYEMKASKDIQKIYEEIAEKLRKLKEQGEKRGFLLAHLQSQFKHIEMLKVPTFIELTQEYLDNNCSVVIFVNYTDSLEKLLHELKGSVGIYGGQNLKERDKNIEDFQNDKVRIIVANIKAGGVGVSLHDINGKHPRVALISPTTSATNLIQVLGRVHRSGGKTKSLQRIIFAANTPEEKISKMLFRKLANISLLNDGELESYYIDGLIEDESVKQEAKNGDLSRDLQIVIDEQLARIKKKNFKKAEHISELFPKLIDTVSGARRIMLVKGRHEFKDIEMLLLGEHHAENKNCKRCEKNCLEITDVVSYIMYSIAPRKLDFYLETKYNPYGKTDIEKFRDGKSSSEIIISRIDKFYETYIHLLRTKYQGTENLRLHSGDVRNIFVNDEENKIYTSMGKSFYIATTMTYMLLGHDLDIMMSKYINKYNEIRYSDNKEFFDAYIRELEFFRQVMKEHRDIIRDVFTGQQNIMEFTKIEVQKQKLLKSWDNADVIKDYVKSIEKYHEKIFSDGTEALEFYDNMTQLLDDIDHIKDKERYMNKFLHSLFNDRKLSEFGVKQNDIAGGILQIYMDLYILFRMLRKFDGKIQDNIVFFGGYFHTKNIADALLNTGMFKLIVKQNIHNDSDCHIIDYY